MTIFLSTFGFLGICLGRVVEERLDRALVTNAWMNIFPRSMLSNLISGASDHSPILLETEPQIYE
jgi:hypothetical protein